MLRPCSNTAQTKTPFTLTRAKGAHAFAVPPRFAVASRRQPHWVPTHPGSLTGAPGVPYSRDRPAGEGAIGTLGDTAHEGASGRHHHRLAPAAGSLGVRRAVLSSLDAVIDCSCYGAAYPLIGARVKVSHVARVCDRWRGARRPGYRKEGLASGSRVDGPMAAWHTQRR